MFSYTISKTADSKAFHDASKLIEQKIIHLNKEELLTDVDGSLIQIYHANGKTIKLFNDYEIGLFKL